MNTVFCNAKQVLVVAKNTEYSWDDGAMICKTYPDPVKACEFAAYLFAEGFDVEIEFNHAEVN